MSRHKGISVFFPSITIGTRFLEQPRPTALVVSAEAPCVFRKPCLGTPTNAKASVAMSRHKGISVFFPSITIGTRFLEQPMPTALMVSAEAPCVFRKQCHDTPTGGQGKPRERDHPPL